MTMDRFHPAVGTWFRERFGAPTEAQARGWAEIASGRDTLIMAPTGSGKTLAAFLAGIDGLVRRAVGGELDDVTRIVYVSPLKALGADVERNLEAPLRGIEATAMRLGTLVPPIRTALRTGDTSQTDRARILRRPPHVLITTPESLYLLLTSEKGRGVLGGVETVIVDEIHALVGNKRGAHLALSLERLGALVGRKLVRIGLSATVQAVDEVAHFLVGSMPSDIGKSAPRPCRIVDAGRKQPLDIGVEVPKEPLGAVASREAWKDVHARLGALIGAHKTTLIFVPSRRMCERVAHDLEALLGKGIVAAHHGALAKRTRLGVERRLQSGQLRAVVATASLELGIDIGDVELVCQLGSPRSIAVLRQRIGRAHHSVGGTPKGRIFAMTRDELVECAAAARAMVRGQIDRHVDRPAPLDVLSQQLVATCAAGKGADSESAAAAWGDDELYALVRGAAPYAGLPRQEFDDVVAMLGDGIATRRGRSGAHLHLDRVNGKVRGRRGARLAALTSGGAIPDKADYAVVEDPTGAVVGTLDEDFAIESMAGDIFLLGSHSWRIRRVENGVVRVEDAAGLPPTVPFWNGEGLARSGELSREVAQLRAELLALPSERALELLVDDCKLERGAAVEALQYVVEGAQALGAVPTQTCVVAERFFDDAGGMQLVIHAPFGARINRAWGLALRKKFCRTFDFELQAAASDDAILLSIGPQHSFPLDAIFGFVTPATVEETLVQAALQSPMWETRWRWNATRALAVLRFTSGKRTPPPLLRMRAADLMAAVFPEAAGCQDNHGGAMREDMALPEHPLVTETVRDCLQEAMDADGLRDVLERVAAGEITCVARDTVAPSPWAHAILNAMPYTFLDDAPLEERRSRAVKSTRTTGDLGIVDGDAIRAVVAEAEPDPRDADELHDLLCTAIALAPRHGWRAFYDQLAAAGRASTIRPVHTDLWVATERRAVAEAAYAADDVATTALVGGFLMTAGPQTAAQIGAALELTIDRVDIALARLEADGRVLQGHFAHGAGGPVEWCERGLLQRIHRRTIGTLRERVRPVTPADFVRFLLRWQHVMPGTRLHGVEGVAKVVDQLEGLELPAAAWEREVLPSRVHDYAPAMLDELCLSGEIAWARLRVTPPEAELNPRARAGAIGLFARTHAGWLIDPYARTDAPPSTWEHLSPLAREVAAHLERRGAAFVADLATALNPGGPEPMTKIEDALWELLRTGAATSDGFAGLRSLLTPRADRPRRGVAGRWSLLHRDAPRRAEDAGPFGDGSPVELAWAYLRRWGVMMRQLLVRESAAPPWRELVAVYRRLEARGEIRGGRFVSGVSGEQFALPGAVEALRALHHRHGAAPPAPEEVRVAATDPLNLVGILTPGPRVPSVGGHSVAYRNGVPNLPPPAEISRGVA
ncbi:MAG TPA: DEAD/DEAH box helicase [Polyangia bacterium]|nr:DEAD/DEAH box helicase [Polyangia bacterium]